MESITYPIRINRYLFLKQYCSRRQADRFIESGHVLVNGKKAVLGQKVTESDTVEVKKQVNTARASLEYYAFNKPVGIVTTTPQRDEQGIEHLFAPASKNAAPNRRVSPVGRLDKESRGLVFLTNDGRIVHAMLSPDNDHEKEYVVQVNKDISPRVKRSLEHGVVIEGYKTKQARVKILDTRRFVIVITEGKKHQIRRMVTALGYEVVDLRRTRIMNIKLGTLPEGTGRKLTEEELYTLLKTVGIVPEVA